jgi:hypothetical protein
MRSISEKKFDDVLASCVHGGLVEASPAGETCSLAGAHGCPRRPRVRSRRRLQPEAQHAGCGFSRQNRGNDRSPARLRSHFPAVEPGGPGTPRQACPDAWRRAGMEPHTPDPNGRAVLRRRRAPPHRIGTPTIPTQRRRHRPSHVHRAVGVRDVHSSRRERPGEHKYVLLLVRAEPVRCCKRRRLAVQESGIAGSRVARLAWRHPAVSCERRRSAMSATVDFAVRPAPIKVAEAEPVQSPYPSRYRRGSSTDRVPTTFGTPFS